MSVSTTGRRLHQQAPQGRRRRPLPGRQGAEQRPLEEGDTAAQEETHRGLAETAWDGVGWVAYGWMKLDDIFLSWKKVGKEILKFMFGESNI